MSMKPFDEGFFFCRRKKFLKTIDKLASRRYNNIVPRGQKGSKQYEQERLGN